MQPPALEHVSACLQKDPLTTLTQEQLSAAFRDDGIRDIDAIAQHMLRRLRHDEELRASLPAHISFGDLRRPASVDAATKITHPVPSVPFVFGGVTYDPQDIRRFDGKALHVIPLTQSNGETLLQVFDDAVRPALANFLELRYLANLLQVFPKGAPFVPGGYTPGSTGSGDYPPPGTGSCGGITGIACGQSGASSSSGGKVRLPPYHIGQVQMFSDADYDGDWFWLSAGYQWPDLTRVGRGGVFGGHWNDAISSLAWTNTFCVYSSTPNFAGLRS